MNSAVYVIGDVQGCCTSLNELISVLPDGETANFWFVGDLINRGPQSLQALRTIKGLGDRAACVLGNHDLHLLAAAAGIRKPSPRDTLSEILQAPDSDELIDWLRHQPLALYDTPYLMVHAGVHPSWTLEQTLDHAEFVHTRLRSDNWQEHLAQMYGNKPDRWDDKLLGADRLRTIINTFTRMRMLDQSGRLDMDFKDNPASAPANLTPWYEAARKLPDETIVVFGHWSTLGLVIGDRHIATDSGCVWGGQLSAVRLGDHAVHQVHCQQARAPDGD